MRPFQRTHLSDKNPLLPAAARVVVCTATGQWNPQPSIPADRREGRLKLRSRCELEKSAMPSLLTGIANQFSRSPGGIISSGLSFRRQDNLP
jgi:hypothetical protein